ncbi:hypothetical protein ACIQUG_32440 [Ensifer sp. NPDC090286]|uniref:hypothetical protein n=1 Tax=Ensifer sp. NPDC090286 TaxID=3363991 RepID=UPI00383B6E4D
MNGTTFLAYARRAPFGGRLMQTEIDGMNAILGEWDRPVDRKGDRQSPSRLHAVDRPHETGAAML